MGHPNNHIPLKKHSIEFAATAAARPDGVNILYFPTGRSPRIDHVRRMIEQVASFNTNVLITGEPGTGKEWAARYIHALSPRRDEPFVRVNCGSIPDDVLESELFGHDVGAFAGAVTARAGRLEIAERGTLFLDEIGEISRSTQAKLLRVLQERVYERVGSDRSRPCDVRIVAASNRDLEQESSEGRFREDLFYRLNVFPVELPPLRERIDDLGDLIDSIRGRCTDSGLQTIKVTPGAILALKNYGWPGNIRELSSLIERLCVLYPGSTVDIGNLPARYTVKTSSGNYARGVIAEIGKSGHEPRDFGLPSGSVPLKSYLENIEIALIRRALRENNGVIAHAARYLQIRRTTLAEKMKRYGISANKKPDSESQ